MLIRIFYFNVFLGSHVLLFKYASKYAFLFFVQFKLGLIIAGSIQCFETRTGLAGRTGTFYEFRSDSLIQPVL